MYPTLETWNIEKKIERPLIERQARGGEKIERHAVLLQYLR